MSRYTQTMEQIVLDEEKKQELKGLYTKSKQKKPYVYRVRTALAVAACAALVLTSVAVRYQNTKDTSLFTVSVMAAELSDTKAAYISDKVSSALDIGMQWNDKEGADSQSTIDYSICTPITCEGENIISVTYSITGAYFQIITSPEDTLVMEGSCNGISENVSVAAGEGEPQYCTSYTVDYDKQDVDGRYVNVFRTLTMPNVHAQELNGRYSTVEQNAQFYSEILNGVEITCTVTLQDGTTASQVLGLEGTVMKNKDTGLTYDWQTMYPEEEDAYIMIRTIDGV